MFGLSTTVIAAIAVVFLVLVLVLLIVLNTRQKKAKALAQRVEKPWDANSEQAGGRRGSTPAPSGKQVPPSRMLPRSSKSPRRSIRASKKSSPPSPTRLPLSRPIPWRTPVIAPAPATEAAESVIEWEAEPIVEDEAATAPAPEAVTAPEEPYRQAPPVEPARPAGAQAPPAAGTPLADPVAYLIASLLEGQGDLTEAELRRLELYRPGRVITVAEGLKAQMTGKGKEARLSRLARVPAVCPDPAGPGRGAYRHTTGGRGRSNHRRA